MPGLLYVIATPIGGSIAAAIPLCAVATIRDLRDFVAENAKSARAFLGTLGMPCLLRELNIGVLDEHTPLTAVKDLLAPVRQGRPMGLLSEAGCAAVADPGALLIEAAHREGFRVVPLVGPSSILLALMACGLEGQRFAFCGYLPRERAAREARIRQLEQRSRRERETQIFIETPYRNDALLSGLLAACSAATKLCIAADLTLPTESVATRTIGEWRARRKAIGRRPAVFLLYAAG